MGYKIEYNLRKELPNLAWIALINDNQDKIIVYHGRLVEYSKEWMVEGVWDDKFENSNFDLSMNFFGSGLKLANDSVKFVISKAMDNRMMYCFYNNQLFVSNSFVLMLNYTGAKLDLNHNYNETFTSERGIKKYEKKIPIIHPHIKSLYQVFYETLVYRNGKISFESISNPKEFGSYAEYYTSLMDVLNKIKNNYQSKHRKYPMSVYSTLSSGYDSTATTVLVKNIGVKTCFTSKYSKSSIPKWINKTIAIDSGKRIADKLKLDILFLESNSKVGEDELYFFASGVNLSSSIYHSMASYIYKTDNPAIVFTGHGGAGVWDHNVEKDFMNDELLRADRGGLSCSEIRLKSGYIQVSVPFIFGRDVVAINKISKSKEMETWQLNNAYDRPIPRRIVEEAGIPRNYFGMHKKACESTYFLPQNIQLRKEFLEFIYDHFKLSSFQIKSFLLFDRFYRILQRVFQYIRYIKPKDADKLAHADTKPSIFLKNIDFQRLIFIWATNRLSTKLILTDKNSSSISDISRN